MNALQTAILFAAFAAGLAALAYVVDMYAQWFLDSDSLKMAEATAYGVASQVSDAVAAAGVPGVVELAQYVYIPRSFPGFDAAAAQVCVYNLGGMLSVYAYFEGYRGAGYSRQYWNTTAVNITNTGLEVYLYGHGGCATAEPGASLKTAR